MSRLENDHWHALVKLDFAPCRHAHEGAELAIAVLSQPEYSVVLRTLWRVKSRKHGPGLGENKRPDFQELLTHIKLAVWLKKGKNEDAPVCLPTACGKFLRHRAQPFVSADFR